MRISTTASLFLIAACAPDATAVIKGAKPASLDQASVEELPNIANPAYALFFAKLGGNNAECPIRDTSAPGKIVMHGPCDDPDGRKIEGRIEVTGTLERPERVRYDDYRTSSEQKCFEQDKTMQTTSRTNGDIELSYPDEETTSVRAHLVRESTSTDSVACTAKHATQATDASGTYRAVSSTLSIRNGSGDVSGDTGRAHITITDLTLDTSLCANVENTSNFRFSGGTITLESDGHTAIVTAAPPTDCMSSTFGTWTYDGEARGEISVPMCTSASPGLALYVLLPLIFAARVRRRFVACRTPTRR